MSKGAQESRSCGNAARPLRTEKQRLRRWRGIAAFQRKKERDGTYNLDIIKLIYYNYKFYLLIERKNVCKKIKPGHGCMPGEYLKKIF